MEGGFVIVGYVRNLTVVLKDRVHDSVQCIWPQILENSSKKLILVHVHTVDFF